METITQTIVIKTNEEITTISFEIQYTGEIVDLESFIQNSMLHWCKLGYTDELVEKAFNKVNIF